MSATTRPRPVGLIAESAEAAWYGHARDCRRCPAGQCERGQVLWQQRVQARAELSEEAGRGQGT